MNKRLFWSIVIILVLIGTSLTVYAYVLQAKEYKIYSNMSATTHIEKPIIYDVIADNKEDDTKASDQEESEYEYVIYDAPFTSGFKSYMDYRTITSQSSSQYTLQRDYAYTGDYGIMMVDGRYCIALGSYFTSDIGQYVDLILENGTVIPCILADQKADIHTDENNMVTVYSGCLTEFVINTDYLDDVIKIYGDISYVDNTWDSPVKEIKVYDKNIFH